MNLAQAEILAKQLMKEHLPTMAQGQRVKWGFKWSHAKRQFGVCSWNKLYGIGYIKLSKHLVELNDEERVRNTILHEIAHALDVEERGCSSHDENWRRIALSIGCDGERCYNGDDVNEPTSKYSLVCGSCGKESPVYRKPKRTKACGKCCKAYNNGKFSHDYVLDLKQNY